MELLEELPLDTLALLADEQWTASGGPNGDAYRWQRAAHSLKLVSLTLENKTQKLLHSNIWHKVRRWVKLSVKTDEEAKEAAFAANSASPPVPASSSAADGNAQRARGNRDLSRGPGPCEDDFQS